MAHAKRHAAFAYYGPQDSRQTVPISTESGMSSANVPTEDTAVRVSHTIMRSSTTYADSSRSPTRTSTIRDSTSPLSEVMASNSNKVTTDEAKARTKLCRKARENPNQDRKTFNEDAPCVAHMQCPCRNATPVETIDALLAGINRVYASNQELSLRMKRVEDLLVSHGSFFVPESLGKVFHSDSTTLGTSGEKRSCPAVHRSTRKRPRPDSIEMQGVVPDSQKAGLHTHLTCEDRSSRTGSKR